MNYIVKYNTIGKENFFKISFIITFLVLHYIFKFTFSYSHNFINYKNSNVKYKTRVNLSQIYMQNVCAGCVKDIFFVLYTVLRKLEVEEGDKRKK